MPRDTALGVAGQVQRTGSILFALRFDHYVNIASFGAAKSDSIKVPFSHGTTR
jgi:hypothetical protein